MPNHPYRGSSWFRKRGELDPAASSAGPVVSDSTRPRNTQVHYYIRRITKEVVTRTASLFSCPFPPPPTAHPFFDHLPANGADFIPGVPGSRLDV